MNSAIFSFTPLRPSSMLASSRIGLFLQNELSLPAVTDGSIENHAVDLLIIINGAFAFCKHLSQLATAIVNAKHVVWVQNDYTIVPPKDVSGALSPFRKAWVDRKALGKPYAAFWTTVEPYSKLAGSSYVNWNALTFNPLPDRQVAALRAQAGGDLLYYGAYRNNRVTYFDRYFKNPLGPVTISSPTRKFEQQYSNTNIRHQTSLENFDKLAKHGMGLYLEDKRSHTEFHSPANRFYEMLGAGLPMVFQLESVNILRRAHLDVSPWAVLTWERINTLMEQRDEIGKEQRALWVSVDHKAHMKTQLAHAWTKTRGIVNA